MNVKEKLEEFYPDDTFIVYDGLNDAVIGVLDGVLCYSYTKIIEVLMRRDGMTEDEAMEYAGFNITGGYLGPKTPHVIDDTWFQE